MIALFTKDKKRFRVNTDEWWVLANWNPQFALIFADQKVLDAYCAKHGITEFYQYPMGAAELEKGPNFGERKKTFEAEYDATNGSFYCFVLLLHFYNPAADEKLTKELDNQVFSNLAGAQAFYLHRAAEGKTWERQNENKGDDHWALELDPMTDPEKAYMVTIHELLLVKK